MGADQPIRAGFLGAGQGACYWHGVGGFRRQFTRSIIIMVRADGPAALASGHLRSQRGMALLGITGRWPWDSREIAVR